MRPYMVLTMAAQTCVGLATLRCYIYTMTRKYYNAANPKYSSSPMEVKQDE